MGDRKERPSLIPARFAMKCVNYQKVGEEGNTEVNPSCSQCEGTLAFQLSGLTAGVGAG